MMLRMTKIILIIKYYKISGNDLPRHQQSSHEADLHWSTESSSLLLFQKKTIKVLLSLKTSIALNKYLQFSITSLAGTFQGSSIWLLNCRITGPVEFLIMRHVKPRPTLLQSIISWIFQILPISIAQHTYFWWVCEYITNLQMTV